MNERRIKGRVVDVWNFGRPDVVCYVMTLYEDFDKKRRVFVHIPRSEFGVVALLDDAFFQGYVFSMTALYEERDCAMFVHKAKDFKVEDDVVDKNEC